MTIAEDILGQLKSQVNADNVKGMASFGIAGEKRLGVSVPDMRKIAKGAGKDHRSALELWETGIPEAMIVASMIDRPEDLTEEQMDSWVEDFNSWDVCDQVCMNLFDKSPLAWKKVDDWSRREEEFVKRAAFALIACLAWHDKETEDAEFVKFLPLMVRESTDDRNYVKKAVNWSLRQVGKRNKRLNRSAIKTAQQIGEIDSRAARWIGSHALRELQSEAVQKRVDK